MKFVIVGINGKMGQEVKKAIFNSGDLLTGGIDTTKDESNNVFTSIYDIQESFDSIIDFSKYSVGEVVEIFDQQPIVRTLDGSILIRDYECQTVLRKGDILH